jgi:hypothetical protein
MGMFSRRRAGVVSVAVLAAAALVNPANVPGQSGAASGGHCSRAAADQAILTAHREASPGEAHPAAQVLCGSVLGPGVEAMVASVRIPSCGLTGDWLVWRYAGGWQRVFESGNGVTGLVVVGGGIKETQNVLRPGDPHCFPTGGTRSRVWHWNGSRLVGTVWRYSKPQTSSAPATASSKLFYFESPSRNIWCGTGDEDIAFCVSKDPLRSVKLSHDGKLVICRSGCSVALRRNGGPGVPVLAYGASNLQGGYLCKSEMTGITCTDTLPGKSHGKGFTINRDGITKIS